MKERVHSVKGGLYEGFHCMSIVWGHSISFDVIGMKRKLGLLLGRAASPGPRFISPPKYAST